MVSVEALGQDAANVMMKAAVEFMLVHGLKPDLSVVAAELRAGAAGAVAEALQDARDAMDAGMGATIAVTTFRATMALAGIDAVHRACKG